MYPFWLRSLGVVLVGVTMASAAIMTLQQRPAIKSPELYQQHYADDSFQATLQELNGSISSSIASAHIEPVQRADNLTVARRLSLGLIGSGMSLEEIRAFELVESNEQLNWWTDVLLADPRWSDYFSQRFVRAAVGTDNGPFLLFRRRKLNTWLAEQLANDDVGFDEIVRDMISAQGLWTDTPAVNFVTATMDEGAERRRSDPIRLAGRTARAFLAQRIDCVQCHDDFLGTINFVTDARIEPGVQQHFHGLAAFYAGTVVADPPFRGIIEDGRPYRFQFLGEEEEEVVEPQVPFSQELLPKDGKSRERLASWVTNPENLAFSRAIVNRVWALMFSKPLVEPVDSIPLDRPVPEALDILARDFSGHGFDIKRLIRLVTASDAFRRDSRSFHEEITEAHELTWAAFPVTQLRPDQVAGALLQACKLTAIDDTSSIFTQLRVFGDGRDFLKRFGDRGEDEFEGDAVTIPQRLLLMNGKQVREGTKVDLVNNASSRIATMIPDDERAIEISFLCTLNRRPTDAESRIFKEYFGASQVNRSQTMGDIFWTLINTTEFSWNH
ncbi:MAG: DUF1553 domain-containing protein [Planctomycetales bacterium]|nr:DUF1553 domain-containing protein [Planctomycetales bacterium]